MTDSDAAIREAAGRLRAVHAWAKDHFPTYQQVVPYLDEVLARYQPVFASETIPLLTEDEFRGFLLFDNNRHWTLHRQGSNVCADMDRLRQALTVLVDESRPVEERLDLLIPKGGSTMVPYFGRGVITAILLVTAPEKHGVWNNTSEAGLKTLGVFPAPKTGAPFSERYLALNAVLHDLAREVGTDLWTLGFLFYALAEHDKVSGGGEDEDTGAVTAEPTTLAGTGGGPGFELEIYLHQFMRDNWERIDLGQEWDLLQEDGEIVGFEYKAGSVGYIDLLAHHKTEPRWLVLELKRNQSSDATVGQVLRYMGWVKENLAPTESVEGLIVARSEDPKIGFALEYTTNVGLRRYEIDFRLVEPPADAP